MIVSLNEEGLLVLITLACTMVCEDNTPHVHHPDPQSVKGIVRPVGIPTGAQQTQEVGPEGGKVVAENGMLTINVPAGALSETVTIGFGEIGNSILQVWQKYALNTTWPAVLKPVEISFSYAGHKRKISFNYAREWLFRMKLAS